jgi:protein-S-isoprenylcysteine O-methyltransferase Ste14
MQTMATAWTHRDKYSSVDSTLKRLYFFGVLAQVLIRIPHERRRRKTRMVVERVDALERALVGLLFVGVLFVPAVYASTSWLDRADYRLPPKAQRSAGGVGAALMTFAVWLFWRSHADLGHNWSPSLQLREGHELVTEGVYRYVRHPMYASEWLWGIAQALVLQNWIAGWAGLALFAPLHAMRVPREEQMMVEQFGEAYREYINRTGSLVPRLGG